MNSYDRAHELAREVARSSEYRALLQAKEAIMADPAASRMMNDYERKQQAVYQLYQSGGVPAPEQLGELRALVEIMRQNSVLAGYMQADSRLGQLISDIQKIIIDAISDARWEVE